jgi:glycosyltransferase involved in cell wall biosynthesis
VKLLLLTTQLDVGGIETNIVRLVRSLTRRGHHCAVGARPGTVSDEVVAAGGSIVPLGMRPLTLLADVLRLRRHIARAQPDAIHVFSATAAAVTWLALRTSRRRPPVVASVMGLAESPDEPIERVERRARLVVRGADLVIVTAPAIGAVVRRLGVAADRIVEDTVVGVEAAAPVTTQRRMSVRATLGVDERTPVVSTIGRLEPRKSPDLFVDAAAQVLRQRPDVVFLVIGDGSLEVEVEARVRELGLSERIRLLGSRRDIEDLLVASDVYVRPGVLEGFIGITVLEAQAVGVPVVSFRTEDVQLAIEHEETGLLARLGDAADLAVQIERLLTDRSLADRIGQAGRRRFLDTYELEGVVKRLEQHYRRVAGEGAR